MQCDLEAEVAILSDLGYDGIELRDYKLEEYLTRHTPQELDQLLRDANLEPMCLSAMEFKLLQFLVEKRGIVHSRDELLDAVWGYDAMPTTRTVDVHIAWLRQKLEPNPKRPQYIHTVHGMGYKFAG